MSAGKSQISFDMRQQEELLRVSSALASDARLKIIDILIKKSMTKSDLAEALLLPMSSISLHTKLLEEAGIISITTKPGKRGIIKLCGMFAESFHVDFDHNSDRLAQNREYQEEIKIGSFHECRVTPPCGLISTEGYIEKEDKVQSFFSNQRNEAGLIWFSEGYLDYHISNQSLKNRKVEKVSLTFEICAEAPGYNHDWPSDLSLEINSIRLHSFIVNGDYGGRRGLNNPFWWDDGHTQYGETVQLDITADGTFFYGEKVSQQNLTSLRLHDNYYFNFKISTTEGSDYIGGINLFGRSFGDFPHDILLTVHYSE